MSNSDYAGLANIIINGVVEEESVKSLKKIVDEVEDGECETWKAIVIFLVTALVCMLLSLFLPISSCLIVGTVIFIILYLAALLDII